MQNGLVVIRKGRLKDRALAVRVWHEFMEYHARISDLDHELVENAGEIWMQNYDRHVRSPLMQALVAERDGEIVGFLLGEIKKRPPIFKTPHQAFLDSIGVLEGNRNQGIGGLMIDAFEKWARKKGTLYVMLNVVVENAVAQRVYEKHGFKTILLCQRKLL